jgi:hypothetical protein
MEAQQVWAASRIRSPSKKIPGLPCPQQIPITKHQSLTIDYNNRVYINYGGDCQNLSVGRQYFWIGWPK